MENKQNAWINYYERRNIMRMAGTLKNGIRIVQLNSFMSRSLVSVLPGNPAGTGRR